MKSRATTAASLVLAVLLASLADPAHARPLSLGFYGSAGGGVADWDGSGGSNFDEQQDTQHNGVGVVLDVGAPFNALNYRLSLGWERIAHRAGFYNPGYTLEGVVIDQDLLIALAYWPETLRLWVGPELRVGFFGGSPDVAGLGTQDFLALGLGPVFGLDYAVSPTLAISWKFGYLATGYSGRRHSSYAGDQDATLGEGHAYASLAILFSTGSVEPRERPRYERRERSPRRR